MKYLLIFEILFGALLLSSCSKKDVKQDAPDMAAPVHTFEPTAYKDEENSLGVVHFDFDKSALTKKAKKILLANAKWLKQNPEAKIQIEGHCDERGSSEYNDRLGKDRANAVKAFLRAHGVKQSRMSVISFGKERPVDPGHDESAWAQNRRVAFRMMGNS